MDSLYKYELKYIPLYLDVFYNSPLNSVKFVSQKVMNSLMSFSYRKLVTPVIPQCNSNLGNSNLKGSSNVHAGIHVQYTKVHIWDNINVVCSYRFYRYVEQLSIHRLTWLANRGFTGENNSSASSSSTVPSIGDYILSSYVFSSLLFTMADGIQVQTADYDVHFSYYLVEKQFSFSTIEM